MPKLYREPSRAETRLKYLEPAARARELGAPGSVLEAAAWRRVTPRSIRQWIKEGRLSATMGPAGWEIEWPDLDAMNPPKIEAVRQP